MSLDVGIRPDILAGEAVEGEPMAGWWLDLMFAAVARRQKEIEKEIERSKRRR